MASWNWRQHLKGLWPPSVSPNAPLSHSLYSTSPSLLMPSWLGFVIAMSHCWLTRPASPVTCLRIWLVSLFTPTFNVSKMKLFHFLCAGSFSKCQQWPELGLTKARSQELDPCLLLGWQEPSYSSRHCCLPRSVLAGRHRHQAGMWLRNH